MEHLRATHIREMAVTVRPKLPRAWDPRHANQHFATLYPGVGATEFTAIMRRVFRGARHHFVPPRMHDVLYKTLVSGHNMGEKMGGEKKWCGRCHAQGEHVCETLEHAYADCDRVDALWKMVLARWNAAIGQHLDPSDARVRLLGDRGDQTHALTEHLWRTTHAATMWVIHQTAKASREHQRAHARSDTAHAMLTRVRRELQRILSTAWAERRASDAEHWQAWRTERWIVVRGGQLTVRVLENGFQPEVAPPAPTAGSAVQAPDGAASRSPPRNASAARSTSNTNGNGTRTSSVGTCGRTCTCAMQASTTNHDAFTAVHNEDSAVQRGTSVQWQDA
jgi:hypothetical protein